MMRILVMSQKEVTVLIAPYAPTPSAKAFHNGKGTKEELLRGNLCSFGRIKLPSFWLTKYNLLTIPPSRCASQSCKTSYYLCLHLLNLKASEASL